MSDSVSRSYYHNHGESLHQMIENKQAQFNGQVDDSHSNGGDSSSLNTGVVFNNHQISSKYHYV